MEALNTFFKNLAESIGFPDFFKGSTLLFNNFFLLLVTVVSLAFLLLLVFLPRGTGKKIYGFRAAERR